jgi:hypothetical protein
MELTPEQAAGKWCPMVRIDAPVGERSTDNRLANWTNPNCIADNCMVWEWVDNKVSVGYCGLSRIR